MCENFCWVKQNILCLAEIAVKMNSGKKRPTKCMEISCKWSAVMQWWSLSACRLLWGSSTSLTTLRFLHVTAEPREKETIVKLSNSDYCLSTFTANTTSELDILGHNGDAFGMDSTEVGVFEERDEVSLSRFLLCCVAFCLSFRLRPGEGVAYVLVERKVVTGELFSFLGSVHLVIRQHGLRKD